MILSLDRDPLEESILKTKRLRPWTLPITERFDDQFFTDVVNALFPVRERVIPSMGES